MEDKELILKIQILKGIKPNQNWVVFTKNQVFSQSDVKRPAVKNAYGASLSDIFSILFQRKFAYAVAVLLFVFAGTFGLLKILPQGNVKVSDVSPAALVAIKSDVEKFKVKSRNLAELSRQESDISMAVKEVKDAAMELTDAIQKDPQMAKIVALDVNNNKTYLNIDGEEENLQATLDALYQTTVEQLLKDFERATLPEDKQDSLNRIKGTFDNGEYEGKYANALEDILLFSAAVQESVNN